MLKIILTFFVIGIFYNSLLFSNLFIRIIYESGNTSGQLKDYQILEKELISLGCTVEPASDNIGETPPGRIADINIFIEQPTEEYLPYAKENYLIPNPECFYRSIESLPKFDKILCRTQDVKNIFSSLHQDLFFLGFTSEDRLQSHVEKDYTKVWHGPGSSTHKNTGAIVQVWENRKDFPPLMIVHRLPFYIKIPQDDPLIKNVSYYLKSEEYCHLQNEYGIHLCPSMAEGYGHYIMEAMSTGSIVITTNAPPMNEFITDPRCLVSYDLKKPYRLGFLYYVNLEEFERTIDEIRKLSKEELQSIGQMNRASYLKHREDFRNRLSQLIRSFNERNLYQ